MIVEDNANLRLDLSELLEMRGYRVWSASDGKEALAALADHPVEAVVSDYEMPNLNGHALLEALRSHPATATIPFILMSGGDPPPVNHLPGCRFMKKPFDIDDLIDVIELLLSEVRDSSQRAPD
jgi:CheY-like chemotaxis protein